MTAPTLTISIEEIEGDVGPLVLTGHNEPTRFLSVSDYTEPAMQARTQYAPSSDDLSGEMPLSWVWQPSILGFNVFADDATTEADLRARIASLTAHVARLSFAITVTVSDADPETWTAQGAGSVIPIGGRTLVDMRLHNPVWSVAIPVYPIRSV